MCIYVSVYVFVFLLVYGHGTMDIKFCLSIEVVNIGWNKRVLINLHEGILEDRIGLDGGLARTRAFSCIGLACTEA